MALSLFDASIPVLLHGLATARSLLEKGRDWAAANGVAPVELLGARLIDDMLPLTAQIQRISDTAKGVAVRVGGAANVPMADDETSFAALIARVDATTAVLNGVTPAMIEARAGETVTLPLPSGPIAFTPERYVLDFALPNFFFHLTTAYALLRHKGVPIGKADFLGWQR